MARKFAIGAMSIVVAIFFLDVVVGRAWAEGAVTAWRVVVVACAAIVAAVMYQAWAVAETRTGIHHAAAGAGLLGGAALTSAAMSSEGATVFSSAAVASLGVAAVIAAVACHLATDRQAPRP